MTEHPLTQILTHPFLFGVLVAVICIVVVAAGGRGEESQHTRSDHLEADSGTEFWWVNCYFKSMLAFDGCHGI